MADFDRVIPPGGEGGIKLRVETKGYSGPKHWSAKVYTNDPRKKIAEIGLKAFVKAPIRLSSRYVYLYGTEGKTISQEVEILAGLERPLTLQPIEFSLDPLVTYRLLEIEKGCRFHIRFSSNPSSQKTYQGFLKLKTNYPEKPEIIIWIRGRWVKARKG